MLQSSQHAWIRLRARYPAHDKRQLLACPLLASPAIPPWPPAIKCAPPSEIPPLLGIMKRPAVEVARQDPIISLSSSFRRASDPFKSPPDDVSRASGAIPQRPACIKRATDALKSSSLDIKCVTKQILCCTDLVNRDPGPRDPARLSGIAQR